eukprot:scaffold15922_cov104-Skeletonema_dohrnii-CCMP3373.AAC.9
MSEDSMSNKSVCAACGIAEVDDIKLKECSSCDLVRYCSDECQKNHASHHEQACKKRAAELRDEILFKQPESSHLGDCPICCLPIPLDLDKSIIMLCCSKMICDGCNYANEIREAEASLQNKCPFCRTPIPSTDEGFEKQRMKRVEANDPVAMRREGVVQYKKGDYSSAIEYCSKAAELGNVEANFKLALLYHNGQGVEKDSEMAMHHLEEAAIGGHPTARYNLGVHEWINDNNERAVKHWIIAATQGHDLSIEALMSAFKKGFVSKDDLATALRAHQAAVDATKSSQREAAEEYYRIEDNSNTEDC